MALYVDLGLKCQSLLLVSVRTCRNAVRYTVYGIDILNTMYGNFKVFWIRIQIGSGFNGVPGSVFGSRSAKMVQKNRKQLIHFIFWSAGCSLLRAKGFSWSFDVLYGGLGIIKLQFFWSKKKEKKFSAVLFFIVLSSKLWIRIRFRIQWIRIHHYYYYYLVLYFRLQERE